MRRASRPSRGGFLSSTEEFTIGRANLDALALAGLACLAARSFDEADYNRQLVAIDSPTLVTLGCILDVAPPRRVRRVDEVRTLRRIFERAVAPGTTAPQKRDNSGGGNRDQPGMAARVTQPGPTLVLWRLGSQPSPVYSSVPAPSRESLSFRRTSLRPSTSVGTSKYRRDRSSVCPWGRRAALSPAIS